MSNTPGSDIPPSERVQDIPRIQIALQRAVREALYRHKLAGHPVAVWRDGRVVWVPPEEIPAPTGREDPRGRE